MPPMIRYSVIVIYIILSLIRDGLALDEESSKIWHSYTFSNEPKNREGLNLLNFTITNFGTVKHVQKWKSIEDHKGVFLLGLGKTFLQLMPLDGESNPNTEKSEFSDWNGYLSDVAVFRTWSTRTRSVESFAVVANCDNNTRSILKWYQIKDGNLVYLWDWPINRIITHINVISLNHELKLLIVSHSHNTQNVSTAEVYSFSVDQILDLWLYDKFSLDDNPSTTHMSYCNGDIYLIFAFPVLETIYIYKHHETFTGHNHFKLQHRLEIKKVSSFTSFCFRFNCYIAIASSNSSIYKFNSKSDLVQVSKNNFGNTRKWLAVQLNTLQENILLLAEDHNTIQAVSLFGGEELKTGNSLSQMVCEQDHSCIGELRKFSAEGATSFSHDKYHYILYTSTTGDGKLLRYTVQTHLLQDVVDSQLKEVLQLQSLLQEKWDEQNLKMEELDKRMSMISNEREAIAPDSWELDHVKAESVTVQMNPNATINSFEFGDNRNWVDEDYSVFLSLQSEPLLHELEEKLTQINSMLFNVERTATIETPKLTDTWLTVDNVIFLGSVTVAELELTQLNDVDVNDMLENSLMIGSNRIIGGVKTVTNINADRIFFDTLNDIPAGDIMFSDQLQDDDQKNVIYGSIIYENDVTILEKLELLPNKDFSPSTLYPFQKGFQFMDGVTFDHLEITEDLVVEESLNGRPLLLPLHNSPFEMISSNSVNQARIERINVENKLNVSFINGRKIDDIMKDLNVKSNSSTVNGLPNKFKNLTTQNLNISYLNDIRFPEGFITTKGGETVTVSGYKNFTGRLIVGDLLIQHRGGSDNANSAKSNVITVEDMKVKGPLLARKINNNTWDVLSDILKQDESSARITSTKTIKKCTFSQNLILDRLNSQSVDSIMNNFSDQEFTGKTFTDVVIERLNVTGTLDNMKVESVKEETVRLSESKAYESSLIFDDESEPYFGSLNISSHSKKFESSDAGREITIYGDLQLKELNSKVLIINGSLMSNDKINNVNLTEFNLNRLSKSQPQTLRGNFNPENITVHDLEVGIVSNPESRTIPIQPESIHELLKSRSYYVDSVIVEGNVKTTRGINGFNITYIDENAVHINKACIINKKIIFEDSVSFKNVKSVGRLQGIKLKRFSQDLIYDSSYVFLRAKKNFINNITVIDKMKARSLNGHLFEGILTKEGDHSVKNSIVINGDVRVTGNVTAYGLVNGSNIMDLVTKYSSKHESYVIRGDIGLRATEIKHLIVDGLIKNKSFDAFLEEVIYLNKDANITARKVIVGSVKFENNVHVEDTMNGLNVTKFKNDIVFVNKDAEIHGDVIMGKTIMQNLIIKNDLNSTLIHGFDTNEWLEESISLSESTSINGKKIFKDVDSSSDIETDYFNGYIFGSVVPLKSEQIIACPCFFPRMKVLSDISVGRWVNDKNLVSEYANTVLVNEDQEIDGSLTFAGDFVVENDLTVEDSNKFDVITLYTDQNISSVIVFEDTVIANSPIKGLKYINGVDIHEWNERSVSLNEDQVIEGKWTVEGNVTIEKNVIGNGLLNGESIPDISKSITKVKMFTADIESRLVSDYNRQCQKIGNLSRMVSLQPNVFHHLEVTQIMKTSVSVESVIPFRANNNDYILLTFFHECLSILYQWNKTSERFNFVNRIDIGPVNKWMTLYYKNATYLITSSTSYVICEKDSKKGNIWIFDGDRDKYGHLFTTDGFSDIIKSNATDGKYFTLGDNGDVYEWALVPKITSDFVVNVGQGERKFVDFEIFGELALSDGRHVKNLQNKVIHTFPKPRHGRITVGMVKGKRVTVVPYRDEIVLYRKIQENSIQSSIPASNADSLMWLNSHSPNPYLLYESEQKSIEMINFKGSDPYSQKISVPISSHKLILCAIPRTKGLRPREFLLVVQKKKVLVLEAYTAGNLYEGTDFRCR